MSRIAIMICPKCGSKNIEKERWSDAVPNAYQISYSAAAGYTGDLICCDCKYSCAPRSFSSSENSSLTNKE